MAADLKKRVYLDYAATTPLDPRVLATMLPYFKSKFGNASSIHSWGQEARRAIEKSREKVAQILGCQPREIIFTGTTTGSDNLAIQGAARAALKAGRGRHLITSSIEHHAVLDTCQALVKQGFELTVLPVDQYGLVDLRLLEKSISKETILLTIMFANNEVGTIQPIKEASRLVKKRGVLFHTDAATVADYLEINVGKLGVDLLTLGAHKFGGPKGVGLLYCKTGMVLEPLTFGGHHEKSLWPGTEAVPLIVGLAKALEIASQERKEAFKRVTQKRDQLIKGVLSRIPDSFLTGHPRQRLPDIASFVIKGVEGEAMILALSDEGIAASTGSACTSGLLKPSHVLTAMGISAQLSHGSLRFSLGKQTSTTDIDYVLKKLIKVVARLRQMAPKNL